MRSGLRNSYVVALLWHSHSGMLYDGDILLAVNVFLCGLLIGVGENPC